MLLNYSHTAARYGQHWKWEQIDDAVAQTFQKPSAMSKIMKTLGRGEAVHVANNSPSSLSNAQLSSSGGILHKRRSSLLARIKRTISDIDVNDKSSQQGQHSILPCM
jgi:hypothetical protein